MSLVYTTISYDLFDIHGLISKLFKHVGHVRIEQSQSQSIRGTFDIWFNTDEVEIKDGDHRQVEVTVERVGEEFKFKIHK